ncbi:MAG: methyltransferase domain-containing protein [Candidatus Diapherotrites archaeon]|nr:methyltransferase domain-containing protein [Candidatus Diapherotrites archaeon]
MNSYNRDLHDFLIKKLDFSSATNVLDIGYGEEYLLRKIKEKNQTISCFGIEKGDAWPNKKFDYVFMCDVIEHLTVPLVEKYFSYVSKNLKVGGYFVISTPNINNLYQVSLFWDEPTHIRPYTVMTLKWYADNYGFEMEVVPFHFFKNPLKILFNKLLLLDAYNKNIFFLRKN